MTHTHLVRRVAVAASAVLSALVLSACGTPQTGSGQPTGAAQQSGDMAGMPGTSSSSDSAAFNESDVAFAQMMISDHRMVKKMAALAQKKANSGDLRSLAAQMRNGQSAAIDTATGWLKDWGKPVSADMAGMTMPGAMTAKDMDKLATTSGMQFDMMFAQMMVKHHEGSLQIARAEQAEGRSREAKAMAADMVDTLTAQVAKLRSIAEM